VRDKIAAGANERLGVDIQMELGAVIERAGDHLRPRSKTCQLRDALRWRWCRSLSA
jgi:hypothetical protein